MFVQSSLVARYCFMVVEEEVEEMRGHTSAMSDKPRLDVLLAKTGSRAQLASLASPFRVRFIMTKSSRYLVALCAHPSRL